MDKQDRKPSSAGKKAGRTRQKKSGSSEHVSASLYPRLIESFPEALIYNDLQGTILLASRDAALAHGYEHSKELIGKKVSDLIAPEEHAIVAETMKRLQVTGTLTLEHLLVKKDGTRFPANVRLSLVSDSSGLPVGVSATIRDLTEQKRAEAALEESQERYRLVSQLSVDYFFKIDIDDNGTPALTYVSDNITAITGRNAGEIKGFDQWITIIHPEDRGSFVSFYQKIMTEGRGDSIECRSFLKSGATRWINIMVHPTINPRSGKISSILGTVKDITDRKLADELIRASLKEKETLLKEIHHRVKNNMQIITSLLNLQAQHLENAELAKHFTEAENRIRSMALVHEKLYQSEDLGHIDFSLYISEVAGMIMNSYSPISRKINMNIDALPVHLPVDQAIPAGLLITELLTNAIRHAFPAGWDGSPEVRISLRDMGDGMVELSISDNGIGLPGDKGLGEGNTLGLSLVPMLVDQINGAVRLNRSGGTSFTITFRRQ
jgi:PAS domain S-box-containing protein